MFFHKFFFIFFLAKFRIQIQIPRGEIQIHYSVKIDILGNYKKRGKPEIQIQKSQIQTKTVFCLECRPKIMESRKSKQNPKNVGNPNKKIAYPNKTSRPKQKLLSFLSKY
jgi:hypothetical protein